MAHVPRAHASHALRLLRRDRFVIAAIFAGAIVGSACEGTVVTTCTVDGKTYQVGDSFPSPDGCNTCTCAENGSAMCTAMACVVTCDYGGKTYMAGETFPATDGCNTCTCGDDGAVACTEKACATCVYAGKTYEPGESFPALDGCNTCTCGEDGAVGCTKIACACDPDKEWWRKYVSKDPAQCMVIDYMCEPNTKAFNNDCGCGCEQDPSCPEYVDCMPPTPCDMDKIHEDCPYTIIAL